MGSSDPLFLGSINLLERLTKLSLLTGSPIYYKGANSGTQQEGAQDVVPGRGLGASLPSPVTPAPTSQHLHVFSDPEALPACDSGIRVEGSLLGTSVQIVGP